MALRIARLSAAEAKPRLATGRVEAADRVDAMLRMLACCFATCQPLCAGINSAGVECSIFLFFEHYHCNVQHLVQQNHLTTADHCASGATHIHQLFSASCSVAMVGTASLRL